MSAEEVGVASASPAKAAKDPNAPKPKKKPFDFFNEATRAEILIANPDIRARRTILVRSA